MVNNATDGDSTFAHPAPRTGARAYAPQAQGRLQVAAAPPGVVCAGALAVLVFARVCSKFAEGTKVPSWA